MKGRSQIRQTRIAAKTRGVTFDAQSTINRWILHMHDMNNVSIISFNELLDMLQLEIQYNEMLQDNVMAPLAGEESYLQAQIRPEACIQERVSHHGRSKSSLRARRGRR